MRKPREVKDSATCLIVHNSSLANSGLKPGYLIKLTLSRRRSRRRGWVSRKGEESPIQEPGC